MRKNNQLLFVASSIICVTAVITTLFFANKQEPLKEATFAAGTSYTIKYKRKSSSDYESLGKQKASFSATTSSGNNIYLIVTGATQKVGANNYIASFVSGSNSKMYFAEDSQGNTPLKFQKITSVKITLDSRSTYNTFKAYTESENGFDFTDANPVTLSHPSATVATYNNEAQYIKITTNVPSTGSATTCYVTEVEVTYTCQ